MYARRVAEGRCTKCNVPVDPGEGVLCVDCADKIKRYQSMKKTRKLYAKRFAARRARNQCHDCHLPCMEGKMFCEDHKTRRNKASREYHYERRRLRKLSVEPLRPGLDAPDADSVKWPRKVGDERRLPSPSSTVSPQRGAETVSGSTLSRRRAA